MSFQIGELVFLQPLWLLLSAVLLIAAVFIKVSQQRSAWQKVISAPVYHYLRGTEQDLRRYDLALIIAAIAAASLSQPVTRISSDDSWSHSTGWIAVADVSRSMTLTDVVPSRLSALRESLAVLSQQAGARPIALVLYAGDAFLVAPPALDHTVFNEHATLLNHGLIPTEGSNLARALSLTSSIVQESQLLQARVFVLTDTGGMTKSSLSAARFLAKAGHQLDVLVFGSTASTMSDPDNTTETAVDIEGAAKLAEAGGGKSIQTSRFGTMDYSPLHLSSGARASTHSTLKALMWRQQSHWLLLLAIPLLLWLYKRERLA